MTTLSGSAIRARLQEQSLQKRLVVSPLLEPSEQLKDRQASIDVRLGFQFALVAPSSFGAIDEFDIEINSDAAPVLQSLYNEVYVPLGGELVIHPHQFILAETLEYLRLPHDLMAYVVGRSTWGRLGLIVATAIGIHPGFAGALTLELRNLGETPLTLHPGQAIAQLFLHNVDDAIPDAAIEENNNQYGGAFDLIPRKMSSTVTHKKLSILKEKFRASRARISGH